MKIKSIVRFDACRDGGSLLATFLDEAGVQTELMFPVELGESSDARLTRVGYGIPVLTTYVLVARVSPVTGLANRDWRSEEAAIAWEDARAILKNLAPLLGDLIGSDSDGKRIYPLMVAIANADGADPGDS